MSERIDLTGRVFSRLTVISLYGKNHRGKLMWDCVCSCGSKIVVNGEYLKNGDTQSCGCFKIENAKALYTKHGAIGTSEYRIWVHLRSRCQNPNDDAFKNYGAKGVSVCDRWEGEYGFINFLSDMGKKPSPKHSLDRFPNNKGNYEPSNCRWATMKEQQNNRTNNSIFEYNGFKGTASQLSDKFGIKYEVLRLRLRRGWAVERALTFNITRWQSQPLAS